ATSPRWRSDSDTNKDTPSRRKHRVSGITGKLHQSYAYSYNGDSVCQDGARTYYDGHGVPCGINVVNQDITYNESWDDGTVHTVHTVRVVEGQKSGWAVEQGDSGGLAFSVASSCCRQARGETSAMNDNDTMFWTEAPDTFGHFGLKLNPHT
ncbi:hypothetical protein AB0D91_48745, partial [Streptomyces canus]